MTAYEEWNINHKRDSLLTHIRNIFIGTDAEGHDLGVIYGMLLFTEQVIKENGKFAGKYFVYGNEMKAYHVSYISSLSGTLPVCTTWYQKRRHTNKKSPSWRRIHHVVIVS